jgi:hypothetical protein
MKREDAIPYISLCLDDTGAEQDADERPDNARLVGWQCGAEPMFVAVWSYLNVRLDDDEASEIAKEYLAEQQWFGGNGPTDPDYII